MKPKLTLRDLFWLVLVAACLCGWSIHVTKQKNQCDAVIAEHESHRREAMKWARALYNVHSEKVYSEALASDAEVMRFAQEFVKNRYWLDEDAGVLHTTR